MRLRPPSAVGYVVAVIAGGPASLVAGAAVFGDGPPPLSAERLVPIIAVYTVLGAVSGLTGRLVWARVPWRRWAVLVSVLGLVAIALLGNDFGLGWQSLYFAATLASAGFGAFVGALAAARLRRKARDG